MKKVLELIVAIVLGILMTPIWMIGGVIRFWKLLFDHPTVTESVESLLSYGSRAVGGYHGDVVICTKPSNVIYEKCWTFLSEGWPKAILHMKVYSFWIEDNKLWIKILINEKLMADLEKELAERKRAAEEEQMRLHGDDE